MKYIAGRIRCIAAILSTMSIGAVAHAETIETRIGKLSFTHDFANGYSNDFAQRPSRNVSRSGL